MANEPQESTEAENHPQDEVVDAKSKKKREYFFKPGHPGHPKGGRPKKVSSKMWQAREIADAMDFNPMIEAIKVYRSGKLPAAPGVKAMPVSATARVKCLETAIAFLLPRLSHAQVSGADGKPIEVTSLDVTQLMRDPELARAAQTLALGMSTATRERTRAISSGTEDIIDAESEDVESGDGRQQ